MISYGCKDDILTRLQRDHYPLNKSFYETLDILDTIKFRTIESISVHLGAVKTLMNSTDMLLLDYLGTILIQWHRRSIGGDMDKLYNELHERLIYLDLFDDNERLLCDDTRSGVIETILNHPWFFYVIYKNPML